jgi:hypothetical protein
VSFQDINDDLYGGRHELALSLARLDVAGKGEGGQWLHAAPASSVLRPRGDGFGGRLICRFVEGLLRMRIS